MQGQGILSIDFIKPSIMNQTHKQEYIYTTFKTGKRMR